MAKQSEHGDGDGAKVWGSAYPPSINAAIPKLGELPAGWSRLRMKDMLEVIERPVKLVDSETYQLVTAKRSRGGIVSRGTLRGEEIKVKQQFEVRSGDFILSNRQIAHGGCGIVPPELDGAVVSGEYTVLRPKPMLDLRFLHYLSHSAYFQQICFHSGVGVHVEKLVFRLHDWLNWQIDIPPLSEQQSIAKILADFDRVIEKNDLLVSAKQRHKLALMQRLFDSGTSMKLSKVAKISFSGVDKLAKENETPVKLCNYTDVYNFARIEGHIPFMEATATETQIARFALKAGDVLFTKDSEAADDIAASAFVPKDLPGVVCGYHLALARPKTSLIDGQFLAYALGTPETRNQFRKLANGVTRFGLNLDAFDQVHICVPDLARQRLVAQTLHHCDLELESLANQGTLIRDQQRGLMQKLLAGSSVVDRIAMEEVAV